MPGYLLYGVEASYYVPITLRVERRNFRLMRAQ